MRGKEIINDIKFRQNCKIYGLNWTKFKIFYFDKNYVICLTDSTGYMYFLLDSNYNTICIKKCDWIADDEDLEDFIKEEYRIYRSLPNELPYRKKFDYPFENFSLQQIIDLANRVEVMETRPLSKDKRWRLVRIVEKAVIK